MAVFPPPSLEDYVQRYPFHCVERGTVRVQSLTKEHNVMTGARASIRSGRGEGGTAQTGVRKKKQESREKLTQRYKVNVSMCNNLFTDVVRQSVLL